MGKTDWGKLDLVLMGGAMLSKSLIQFSFVGWGCVPSLLFGLRPNYGMGNGSNGDLLQKDLCQHCFYSAPDPTTGHCQSTPAPETPGHSQTGLAQSLGGSLLLFPGSWCIQCFACALQESVSAVLCKFYNRISLSSKVRLPGGSQFHCQIPRLGNLLLFLELS